LDADWRIAMIMRVLAALGIGALAMYLFDPASGRRRRALLRDQLVHARHEIAEIADYTEGTAKDLRNRAYGLAAEARGMIGRKLRERRAAAALDVDPSQQK
jgi:hypothetical protein